MEKIVKETKRPNTVQSIQKDLVSLGVEEGMILLVHSSLSKIGWVNGGAVAVIEALMQTVTETGTIVMPAQSSDWSTPARWQNPSVPEEWWDEIKETMPAFQPDSVPTILGAIPECFRTYPTVERSSHPAASFTAWGQKKSEIVENHRLDFGLGDGSPLKNLYDLDAKILFIGTDYETNTAFHLGEYRAGTGEVIRDGARILENGQSIWKEYDEINYEDEAFVKMGEEFEKDFDVKIGTIGNATSKLFSLCEAVNFAQSFFERNNV